MFELATPTPAMLTSITPRQEHHGDSIVVGLSLRLEITGANTLLDLLSPKLRPALYQAVEGQEQLPGVEPSTPLLRFDAFDYHSIKACFEGWTLRVDHGINEAEPITLGSAKVDAFRLQAMQGGTVKLAFRIGTNDVSSDDFGLLCSKLGSEISVTLRAPDKPADGAGDAQPEGKQPPSAGDLFAAAAGGEKAEKLPDGWPFPSGGAAAGTPPQSATVENVKIEQSQPGTRTARGRDKTKKALAAGAAS